MQAVVQQTQASATALSKGLPHWAPYLLVIEQLQEAA